MSNEKTQLPPELVEKMKHEIKSFDWKDITEYQAVDNCTQVAVDYRESEIAVLETDKAMLESELQSLKQQHDTLQEGDWFEGTKEEYLKVLDVEGKPLKIARFRLIFDSKYCVYSNAGLTSFKSQSKKTQLTPEEFLRRAENTFKTK